MDMQRYLLKLVVLVLVAMPLYSRKGSYSTRAASEPPLSSEDVDAVNALLRRANLLWSPKGGVFSNTDCDNQFYSSLVTCEYANGTARRITRLDFSKQQIEGQIPAEIENLTELKILNLGGNKFRGPVPHSLANLTKLEMLDLSNNQLEGAIPSFLGGMKSLNSLILDNNLLSGEIPKEIGKLSSLRYLTLFDNKLEGQLPDDLGNLTNLEELYLMNNRFNGILPSRLKDLQKLQYLNVRGNNLTGKFPEELLLSWPQMRLVWLVGNYFEGPLLPKGFPALKYLYSLHVSNLLGGRDGFQIPDLSQLTVLRHLTLRNCSLTGSIPDFIWQLPELVYLDLSFNQLTGGIPPSINHHSLDTIFLRSNKFNQSLPSWLIHKNISYVDISENFFTSESIPTRDLSQNLNLFECCSKISNLTEKWQQVDFRCPETSKYDNLYINCGGETALVNGSNSYEADVNPEGASTFYLSNSGRWAYSSMGTYTRENGDHYLFSKTWMLGTSDDSLLYQTARGAPISLKYYGLCLKSDVYNVNLHFAEITWDADRVSGIKDRRVFDVEIQGEKLLSNFNIEEEAGGAERGVSKEFEVRVTESRLEIHLYWSGKGAIGWPTQYYGPLISAISVSPAVSKKHKKFSSGAIAALTVSASALLLTLILLILWKIGILGGKKDSSLGIELHPGDGEVYNFQQIKAATQNFADANKIGEGGFGRVYKGVLQDGREIAVKRLSSRSRQGIHEFMNEISTLCVLQHPNLVRLMGFCAQDQKMLLIFEYMQNGSLAHALFGPNEQVRLRLNWPTRFKICLDIAKGLAFLHEESEMKIIHRDIKATNILLDKDLNAKISDFGLSKIFGDSDEISTRIAGTLGYMAPEYAMQGVLTPRADVYSFGIVSLEIVSGKKNATYGADDEPTEYLLDWAYNLEMQKNLKALIDPQLGSEYSWRQASTILTLALMCTNPSPKLRPTMSEVVKILQGKVKDVAAFSISPHLRSSSQQGASSSTAIIMSDSDREEIQLCEN